MFDPNAPARSALDMFFNEQKSPDTKTGLNALKNYCGRISCFVSGLFPLSNF